MKTSSMEYGEAMELAKLGVRVRRPGYSAGSYVVWARGQFWLQHKTGGWVFEPRLREVRAKDWEVTT